MKNISDLHSNEQEVSAKSLFKNGEGTTTSIQLQQNGKLNAHKTSIPALLVCVSGKVIYSDEKNIIHTLESGDYVMIRPQVTHWLTAEMLSQLLLIK